MGSVRRRSLRLVPPGAAEGRTRRPAGRRHPARAQGDALLAPSVTRRLIQEYSRSAPAGGSGRPRSTRSRRASSRSSARRPADVQMPRAPSRSSPRPRSRHTWHRPDEARRARPGPGGRAGLRVGARPPMRRPALGSRPSAPPAASCGPRAHASSPIRPSPATSGGCASGARGRFPSRPSSRSPTSLGPESRRPLMARRSARRSSWS
jgi:hypothetical protein